MQVTDGDGARDHALARARAHSPFLRGAAERSPQVVARFIDQGTDAALAEALGASGADLAATLRRQRDALALAVALGDLAGEYSLEQVTGALSDFADHAIDEALRSAMRERVGDAEA